MNPYLIFQPVLDGTHDEYLKRADRARLIKSIRSNDGTAQGVRARLGTMLMRTGARIMPAAEREIVLATFEKHAA